MNESRTEARTKTTASAAEHGTARPEVIAELLARQSDFRSFLRRRVSDEAIAEDLLQQSFLRAVQQEHRVEKPEQSAIWFYRILRNAVIDYYRAHAADNRKIDAFLQELTTSGEDKTPAVDEWHPTVCACLRRLLPRLKPDYAELLQRIDLQGESPAAVAKALDVTQNNLTVRLHRARQALKKSLEESCGVCTKHGCLYCTCAE